ncbi:MAG: recombinase family protein [Parvibaculum sp.]
MSTKKLRCAIYTRKSTEEGLDQDFNSLQAQRESCAAYVISQTHEGWNALDKLYDDGGFSGGNMDRPGLQQLMSDIEAGRIDIVVVYKVDRLTRSLADFAKLVEVFDKHSVSFVSVTQAFNTTSSMGRLTLNVLLSFAQFEREVTAERIRDKFKASKEKGMWMGGRPVLGFDIKDRKLIPNPNEIDRARYIFKTYLEVGSAMVLKERLDQEGIASKQWVTQKGKQAGGKPFTRGSLYGLLSNPIYVGKIRHKDKIYDGQHEAILDQSLWDRVQALLAKNRVVELNKKRAKSPSLLAGILAQEDGRPFKPSHSNKNGVKRRYYRHPSCTLPSNEIENVVLSQIKQLLSTPSQLAEILNIEDQERLKALLASANLRVTEMDAAPRPMAFRSILKQVIVGANELELHICPDRLKIFLSSDPEADLIDSASDRAPHIITLQTQLKRCGHGKKLIVRSESSADPTSVDTSLIKLIGRAHMWFDEMKSGSSYKEIAAKKNVDERLVARTIRCTFLAPDITSAILKGQEPSDLSSQKLLRLPSLPATWDEQRDLLGFN